MMKEKKRNKSNPMKIKINNVMVLNRMIRKIDLRCLKSEERKGKEMYTSFHKSYSRIDYTFASKSLTKRITDVDIIKVTDHALLNMEIKVKCDHR